MTKPKRTTSLDVARLAEVSRTTVSLVLNKVPGVNISEETRRRVLAAAQQLHYHPDAAGRKLVSGKSNTIGLVVCQAPEQVYADAFLPQVILGLEQAAFEQGFHVLLKPVAPQDPQGYAHLISENLVDGIVLSGPRQDDLELFRLQREGVPLILLGQMPDSGIAIVDIDAVAGAETAVNHLIELGHERIAMITNAPLTYTSAQQRRDGYLRALEKAGLPVNPDYVQEGYYTPASGHQAMSTLLNQRTRPTAVFVASDVVAMGAILAARRAGVRLPQDLSLVGFDDVPLAEYFDPPLTTIRLPAYGLGWSASERLIRLIKGEGVDKTELLLNTELIVRESSARCPV